MICFLQVLLHTPKNGDEDVLHASFSSSLFFKQFASCYYNI